MDELLVTQHPPNWNCQTHITDRTLFSFQNCLNSLWHPVNKLLKMFLWDSGPRWHDSISLPFHHIPKVLGWFVILLEDGHARHEVMLISNTRVVVVRAFMPNSNSTVRTLRQKLRFIWWGNFGQHMWAAASVSCPWLTAAVTAVVFCFCGPSASSLTLHTMTLFLLLFLFFSHRACKKTRGFSATLIKSL